MKGNDVAGQLALEQVDLLSQALDQPLHVGRSLIRDSLHRTNPISRPLVRVVRNPGKDLDAIPAMCERNIGQASFPDRPKRKRTSWSEKPRRHPV